MAARTNAAAVQDLLGADWNSARSVQAFIDTAAVLVDRLVLAAAGDGFTAGAGTWELVERWLSAHYYTKSDPTFSSRSTLGASGSFTRSPTDYWDTAVALDPSGLLPTLTAKVRAGGYWLGTDGQDQQSWDQLNGRAAY